MAAMDDLREALLLTLDLVLKLREHDVELDPLARKRLMTEIERITDVEIPRLIAAWPEPAYRRAKEESDA